MKTPPGGDETPEVVAEANSRRAHRRGKELREIDGKTAGDAESEDSDERHEEEDRVDAGRGQEGDRKEADRSDEVDEERAPPPNRVGERAEQKIAEERSHVEQDHTAARADARSRERSRHLLRARSPRFPVSRRESTSFRPKDRGAPRTPERRPPGYRVEAAARTTGKA